MELNETIENNTIENNTIENNRIIYYYQTFIGLKPISFTSARQLEGVI